MSGEIQVLEYPIELTVEEASAIIQALSALQVSGNAQSLVGWLSMVKDVTAKLQPIADLADASTPQIKQMAKQPAPTVRKRLPKSKVRNNSK